MTDEVKAIRIRGQLHKVSHRGMSGYRTICGKTASFGHQVYQLNPQEVTCPECTIKKVNKKASV